MEPLLLHHCCAPCSPSIMRRLSRDFSLKGYWFNPNIQPSDEYRLRYESMVRFAATVGIDLHHGGEYPGERWFEGAAATDVRCRFCYRLRLEAAARKARELGVACFSTTLLVSPYQKHDLVREEGEAAAEREGVRFVYCDVRDRYYDGRNEAKAMGFYTQKYCGCLFSRQEMIEWKRKREEEKARRRAERGGGNG